MLAAMVTCAPLHNLPEVIRDENMHVRGTLQWIKPSGGFGPQCVKSGFRNRNKRAQSVCYDHARPVRARVGRHASPALNEHERDPSAADRGPASHGTLPASASEAMSIRPPHARPRTIGEIR
jgi:hypothetical protein